MVLDYQSNLWTIYAAAGGTVLAEYTEFTSAVPTWTKSYTYLGDRLFASITPNGVGGEFLEFAHPDRLGTKLTTNQAGNSYEQAHLPFGTALNAETTGSITRRFTSYQRSDAVGLDYAVNRTYDSGQGRFTQVDPIGSQATNFNLPQSLNLYIYCGNDPINQTDPDGLFWGFFKKLFKGIGKALSFIGKVISSVLSNKWVSLIVTILSIAVPAFSVLRALNVIRSIPSFITLAGKALNVIKYIGIVGKTAEINGMLFQGKFAQLGRVIGKAFVGAMIGVIEDSIVNGVLDSIRTGGFSLKGVMKGAWTGLKNGVGYIMEALARFGSKKWWEGFIPIYGFFCGPGYGGRAAAVRADGADGIDALCKRHDEEMRLFDINRMPRGASKTPFDLRFIKDTFFASVGLRLTDIALGGRYRSGEVYRALIPLSFGIRIGFREVR